MPVMNDPSVVSFDAKRAVEGALAVAGADLLLVVEYDRAAFEVLYCADVVADRYPDDEAMHDHFSGVHSYVYLDFTERELFEELFVDSGRTRALTTYMENLIAVRVVAEGEGLFLALAPDAPATAVIEAVEDIVHS
ncbi:hypothetical protein [Halomarina rubra]|uniref:Uncharacterized protein n=1 Tax=Halomarina rubra TaxID=2071873 RepID=A0ABD6B083_9EURY|nr:hypothetical protein [Halomarina rubra]